MQSTWYATRGTFLTRVTAIGAGLAAGDLQIGEARAASVGADTAAARAIIGTALLAEQVAMTFYYTALTTPRLMRDHRLAGRSANPNNPGLPPGGDPGHVHQLQAALDAEVRHADALTAAGATSPLRRVYFPARTFARLGSAVQEDSLLGVMAALEATLVGLYIAAASELMRHDQPRLAALAAEILGVEAEHRLLSRLLVPVLPANNLTLEEAPFTGVSDARSALQPFVTAPAHRASAATAAFAIPTRAQAARVIGRYRTRRVRRFL